MSRYTKANHTVYLYFMSSQNGWHCQFLEADLKTSLPRTFTFAHADKIRELARRGEAWGTLESKQALEQAIEMGRGGLYAPSENGLAGGVGLGGGEGLSGREGEGGEGGGSGCGGVCGRGGRRGGRRGGGRDVQAELMRIAEWSGAGQQRSWIFQTNLRAVGGAGANRTSDGGRDLSLDRSSLSLEGVGLTVEQQCQLAK